MKLVLTCEHAGNKIPEKFEFYFKNQKAVLHTHRGFDLGAFDLFKELKPLSDFSLFSNESRLLIELNRSLNHKKIFSEFTRELSTKEKVFLINEHYLKYRNQVEFQIREYINKKNIVLHVSVHSFTPVFNEKIRNCDIGLLFDSRILLEKRFSKDFKNKLLNIYPDYKVRFNYPYLGKADGFTTYLRKIFPENYIGIELEINQKFSTNNKLSKQLKKDLYTVLKIISNL